MFKAEQPEKSAPQKMNPNKLAQFTTAQKEAAENVNSNSSIKEELELLKQLQKQKQEDTEEEVGTTSEETYEEVQPPEQFTHRVSRNCPNRGTVPRRYILQFLKKLPQSPEPEQSPVVTSTSDQEEPEYFTQEEIVDTGITAVALYDYQAAAEDEISFDPDNLITHIEKVRWKGFDYAGRSLVLTQYFRLMKDGGEVYAKENTDCFQQIMSNAMSLE